MSLDDAAQAGQGAMLACVQAAGDAWDMRCAWLGGQAQGLSEAARLLHIYQAALLASGWVGAILVVSNLLMYRLGGRRWRGVC